MMKNGSILTTFDESRYSVRIITAIKCPVSTPLLTVVTTP